MFWRDNEGKNQTDNKASESGTVTRQTMSREEFLAEDAEAKKVYDEIMNLRKSVETLRSADSPVSETETEGDSGRGGTGGTYLEETEEVIAAKQAIIDRARMDAEKARKEREEIRLRELQRRAEEQKVIESEKQAAMAAEEAEKKRLEAIEAEKKAKEISRKKALGDMEAELLAQKAELSHTATDEEMADFFDEKEEDPDLSSLELAKLELLKAQKHQDKVLDVMSTLTEKSTEKMAVEQQQKLSQQQMLLQEEQQKLNNLIEQQKHERLKRAEKAQAEKQIREQKARIERIKKEEKARKKKEDKESRHKEKERLRRQKREEAEKEKLEKARRIAEAELGGGVVNVHNMKINTRLKSVARFSWRDILGIASKKEKNARSEDERNALKDEREKRREEARAAADLMAKKRIENYEKSLVGRKLRRFKDFCEKYKAGLLTLFAIVLMAGVGTAGVINYCTAYEYSYNGKTLGLVKSKADVLEITDLVQGALTKEKDMKVIIDARDDISFKRVPALGGVKIDTSEEVLKRLTYMGDLNVKAYGIYVNGKKAGAVENKEIAADVLQEIKDRYSTGMEGAEIEEAVFIEKVKVQQSNTDLQDISTKDEMVEKLCTSGRKETLHKVVPGDTLADIAKLYTVSENDILKDNPDIDPKKLVVGSTIVIKQNAPIITAKITELVTYDEKIEYKVIKKDDDDIYEGDKEVTQKGKDGSREVTARIVSVNGEQIEETELVTTVTKEPVNKIIHVGTKERPPTVGSGKFIWPLDGGYTVTSEFGQRWGRLHAGLDLGCPVGSNVRAADGGTVTQAGYHGSYGYLVVIDHQNGMETYYAHNSQLLVNVGDKVYQGQHIAESGNTGRSTGPHCHFEIHVNGSAVNPRTYLP
ncbi:MAG: peptidoglycan DD-metalloendopeptidase family protein [Lentihominibacter sp.]|nr:peptidoglycan DD-metalloendopeptidase family protein [Lentihominibacter sp.]